MGGKLTLAALSGDEALDDRVKRNLLGSRL
jgi:hypothetical protein